MLPVRGEMNVVRALQRLVVKHMLPPAREFFEPLAGVRGEVVGVREVARVVRKHHELAHPHGLFVGSVFEVFPQLPAPRLWV